MNYIKPLDGLRCLAVSLVLIDHWSGDKLGFPASYLGVCIFFVLSGFLITNILINSKKKVDQKLQSNTFALKRFYIRRTLRIFPLYYLTLIVLFILNVPPVRDKIGWLVTYSTNIYIAWTNSWLGLVDHLWSLAVEEQYYLFFPFLILFIPFKNIKIWLVFLICLSISLRLTFYFLDYSWIKSYVLMPTCLDAFGIGGLLALIFNNNDIKLLNIVSDIKWLILSFTAYFIVALLCTHYFNHHGFLSVVWLRLFESIFAFFLIASLLPVNDGNNILKKIFSVKLFVYIGKISYGIYIFHNFIFNYYHTPENNIVRQTLNVFANSGNIVISSTAFQILFLYAITISLASISWFLFEKPINNLKKHF